MHFKCPFCKQELPYTSGNIFVCQCDEYLNYEREESIRISRFNREREELKRKNKRRRKACGFQSKESNE
jgi:hypothetical protein